MSKNLTLKTVYNKKNGQINISLPKRKLPKNFDAEKINFVKIKLKSWF